MKPQCVTIQMKAIEQYFYVVLFVFDNFAKLKFNIFFLSFELSTLGSERVNGGEVLRDDPNNDCEVDYP